MSDSRDQKLVQEDLKEEKELLIDLNAPNCVFKLLPMTALMEAEDGKIRLIEKMSEITKKLYADAREGQGLATIELIYKDLKKDSWVKETFLIPAFNLGDGLVREDKAGKFYNKFTSAMSEAKVGQSGSGVIHNEALQISLLLKELSKRKDMNNANILFQHYYVRTLQSLMSTLSKDEVMGCVIGGALVKGAESHDPKDYKIYLLNKKNNAEDISQIRRNFPQSLVFDDSFLEKYEIQDSNKYGHLFLIQNDEHKSYEVYYIRNGSFIRSATKAEISEIPQEKINFLLKDLEEEKDLSSARVQILEECLKALTLTNPFTMNNKSSSQNDASIFYDPDFESFIMYLNPERYLLDEEKQIMPEGEEWGSFFDLHRSEPMILSNALRDQLLKSFNIQDEKIIDEVKKQQQAKSSSWDDKHPYDKVIKSYLDANKEEKLQVYENNIHLLLRLYEKTLKMYVKDEPIWGREWDYKDVEHYLDHLKIRLIQLLISHHKLSPMLKFDVEFKSPLFEGDTRSLSQVLTSLKEDFSPADFRGKGVRFNFARIKEINLLCYKSLEKIRSPLLQEMEEEIKSLCSNSLKEPPLVNFNRLLKMADFVCSNEKESKAQLQKLLTTIDVDSISALENVVKKESYQTAVMILFYGGINEEILKKVSDILMKRIQKEAIVQQDPFPDDEKPLILDDFLRSFIRQTHRHDLPLPEEFSKLIVDNAKFLPKATSTIEKLAVKEESKAEDVAQQFELHVPKKAA